MMVLAVCIVLFVVLYQKKVLAQQNEIQATENKHQVELLNATIEVAELEREKIAKNIHDDIGTLLNVIKLHLSKISRNPDDKTKLEELIKESMGMLDESIENIRGIAKDLMPPTLIKLGFEKGVSELFRQINASGAIAITYSFQLGEQRLPPKTELQLYRVVHEVINNIIKHSEAKELEVTGNLENNEMVISIAHDGMGITSETVSQLMMQQRGVGLKSIQSRVQSIGARIEFLGGADHRAKVVIHTPLS